MCILLVEKDKGRARLKFTVSLNVQREGKGCGLIISDRHFPLKLSVTQELLVKRSG